MLALQHNIHAIAGVALSADVDGDYVVFHGDASGLSFELDFGIDGGADGVPCVHIAVFLFAAFDDVIADRAAGGGGGRFPIEVERALSLFDGFEAPGLAGPVARRRLRFGTPPDEREILRVGGGVRFTLAQLEMHDVLECIDAMLLRFRRDGQHTLRRHLFILRGGIRRPGRLQRGHVRTGKHARIDQIPRNHLIHQRNHFRFSSWEFRHL